MTSNQPGEAAPSARRAALQFMSGVSRGWSFPEFLVWHDRHLVSTERMGSTAHRAHIVVHEPGVGAVELVEDLWRLPMRLRLDTVARFHLAMVSAHTRVLTTLRQLLATGSTAFVQAAIGCGRLEPALDGEGNEAAWWVSLRPTDALSDAVLALFAVDYLIRPNDYRRELSVCGVCDGIGFRQGQRFRTLCAVHTADWFLRHRDLPRLPDAPPVSGVFRRSSDPSCVEGRSCLPARGVAEGLDTRGVR